MKIAAAIVMLVAAGVITAWSWGAGRPAGTPSVLCTNCGLFAPVKDVKLEGGETVMRHPAFGPGYRCPKCGRDTLYPNPLVCGKCGTAYMPDLSAPGETGRKCPKCGTLPREPQEQ